MDARRVIEPSGVANGTIDNKLYYKFSKSKNKKLGVEFHRTIAVHMSHDMACRRDQGKAAPQHASETNRISPPPAPRLSQRLKFDDTEMIISDYPLAQSQDVWRPFMSEPSCL